jgi:P27 family predicted phage terminase small subunit
MGKRGPRPRPTLAAPGPAGRPLPAGVDAAPPEVAASPHALAVWERLVPVLRRMGVWTAADRETIARYCTLHELHARYADECRAGRDRLTTRTGYEALSPAATMLTKLSASLLSIERQYGLTPTARASIAATLDDDDDDEEARVLRRLKVGPSDWGR